MKKELSPVILLGIAAVAVAGLGFWFYRQVVYVPPTPRVNLYAPGGRATNAVKPPGTTAGQQANP